MTAHVPADDAYDPWDDPDVLFAYDDWRDDMADYGWAIWHRDDAEATYRGAHLALRTSEERKPFTYGTYDHWWDQPQRARAAR